MLATSAAPPRGDECTYEVKWDGYRTLALKQGARVKLLSRNLKDATAHYPGVVRDGAAAADAGLLRRRPDRPEAACGVRFRPGRAAIAAAQKKRWAAIKRNKAASES